jgi:hypothetical protein
MRFIIATLIFSFDIYVKKESDAWGMNQKVYITPERRVSFTAPNNITFANIVNSHYGSNSRRGFEGC